MPLPRFHIPAARWNPAQLVLDDPEARHCSDVLRCKPGDRIIVFNGQGAEATAEISSADKGTVTLNCLSLSQGDPPPVEITLAQAVPKGKTMDFIVQKATELGARKIVPLLSERTVVRLDDAETERKRDKWRRVALEASKQSGQNWLPSIDPPLSVSQFFDGPAAARPGGDLKIIASLQPDAVHFKDILREYREMNTGATPSRALVLIGPEGDFTPAEIATARGAGCLPFSLGPIVLRAETAALYSLSILGYELF